MSGSGITPTVSVVMAVKNYPLYLRLAMESILHQTSEDLEFIVVDYGSTDETLDILKSYNDPRIKLCEYPGLDLVTARNIGTSLAKGKFIAVQDADDASHPTRLEVQLKYMAKYPRLSILGSGLQVRDEKGNLIYDDHTAWDHETIIRQMLYDCPLPHSSVMVRSEVFDDFCYDENLYFAHDYGLWLDIIAHSDYQFAIAPESLYFRCHHEKSITADRRDEQLACAYHALEKHIYGVDIPIQDALDGIRSGTGPAGQWNQTRKRRDRFWSSDSWMERAATGLKIAIDDPKYWYHEIRKHNFKSRSPFGGLSE